MGFSRAKQIRFKRRACYIVRAECHIVALLLGKWLSDCCMVSNEAAGLCEHAARQKEACFTLSVRRPHYDMQICNFRSANTKAAAIVVAGMQSAGPVD